MLAQQIYSPLNYFLDYFLLALGIIVFLLIIRRFLRLLPREKIRNIHIYRFTLLFNAVVITAAIFLCVDLIISAIAKNFLLASDGLLPGIEQKTFEKIFPDFDPVIAHAFLFNLYIPLIWGCMLGYGVIYITFETLYLSTQNEINSKAIHSKVISRILHFNENKGLNILKALTFIVLLFGGFTIMMLTVIRMSILGLDPLIIERLNYTYFLTIPSEVIIGFYLAYFTLSYALLKLGFNEDKELKDKIQISLKIQEVGKSNLFIMITAVLFIILIIFKFGFMWYILFNYNAENINSNFQLIPIIFSFIIQDITLLGFITLILFLFPIEITIFLLLQLYFFFKRFFRSELNKEEKKEPIDLYFISFIIAGYAANFAILFKVYYPWLYVSFFMDESNFEVVSLIYYPKLMISIILNFVFLVFLLFWDKKTSMKEL